MAGGTRTEDLWRLLDQSFEKEPWQNQWTLIQQVCGADANHIAIATSARRLFDLHAGNSKDQGHRKAIGYASLAALIYFRLKRVGPATALIEALRPWGESLQAIKSLEVVAGETLSRESVGYVVPKAAKEVQKLISQELKEPPVVKAPHRPIILFSQLSADEVRAVLVQAQLKKLEAGDFVFRAGEAADAFYIIAEGSVEILAGQSVTRSLDEGDFFGELGLLTGGTRTASLRARGRVELLEFSRDKLFKLLAQYPSLEQRLYQFFCWRLFAYLASKNPYLTQMNEDQLAQFFYLSSVQKSKRGQELMQPGQASDFFLYILMGEVDVTKEGKTFGRLGPGSVVGEIGILTGQARSAHVVAHSDLTYLYCGKIAFEHLKKYFPDFQAWLQKVAAHRMEAELSGIIE